MKVFVLVLAVVALATFAQSKPLGKLYFSVD
jgi:hypothetical protein